MVKLASRLLLLGIIGAAYAANSNGPSEVLGIRLWAAPDNTRVVLDLSRPAEHTLFTLSGPDRVVIDLHRGRMDTADIAFPSGDGFVRQIRSARQPDGDLRVVLDLNAKVQPRSFPVAPNDVYGHRLVIDLAAPRPPGPVKVIEPPPSGARNVVIAVDPGHGGEDPGAIGRRGTREKDIVLKISRLLVDEIGREPGMEAMLTRDGDYFISLRDRIERARRQRADLFVSLHADAFRDRRASGSSVYILSERGASDEATRLLAERENSSDLIGGVALADKDDVLASVLLDLSQNAAISASMTAGENVLGELRKVGKVHKTKVQQAGFVVLKSPDIPSILVETAFISNPTEERNLQQRGHQERMAVAIMSGVRAYFYENPPADSMIAKHEGEELARTESIRYVIARGDTLSAIADRYKVSLKRLKAVNGIKNDRIHAGQVLTIPTGT